MRMSRRRGPFHRWSKSAIKRSIAVKPGRDSRPGVRFYGYLQCAHEATQAAFK